MVCKRAQRGKNHRARPQASAFGEDAYPDILHKAAALMHSLIRNHPFIDGNKRTGFLSTVVFYGLNGDGGSPEWS